MQQKLYDIMKDLGIDKPTIETIDPEGVAYIESLGEITEETIFEEILRYVNECPENELNWVLEKYAAGA